MIHIQKETWKLMDASMFNITTYYMLDVRSKHLLL